MFCKVKNQLCALFAIVLASAAIPASAAIQYNMQTDTGKAYITVDTKQNLYVDVKKPDGTDISVKDSVITGIGWYKYEDVIEFFANLPPPGGGSSRPWDTFGPGPELHRGDLTTGLLGEFSPDDKIVLWVETTSASGEKSTFAMYQTNTKEQEVWLLEKSGETISFNWGEYGYNNVGQHALAPAGFEFAISTRPPSGQPLPGIIATLIVGGGAVAYLKKRKKLSADK